MQFAFYLSGIVVAVITVAIATVNVKSAIERIQIGLAVIENELRHIRDRMDRVEKRHETTARP